MKIMYDYIVAAVAEYDQFVSFDQEDGLEANMAVIRMEQMGRNLLESKFACDSFLCDGGRTVFLINYDPLKPRLVNQYEIHALFERLQIEIYHAFCKTISIGIGDCQENMNGFRKSHQQALKALEQKFYVGENSIISILDVPEREKDDGENRFLMFQDKLYRALEENNMDESVRQVETYFSELQRARQIKPLFLKQRLMGFLLYMYKEQKLGDERYVLDLIDEVKKAETLAELWQWMRTFCQKISERKEQNKTAAIHISIQKVKDYINDNYAEAISLKKMAESVYISQSYLSYAFKEITGIHFNEYLTRVRMEKAKELLQTTDYRVYEVCELVGYRDKKYFTDLFRRYTGVLPKEWARKKQVS